MSARVALLVVVGLGLGLGAGLLIAGGDDDQPKRHAVAAQEQPTFPALEPKPFRSGLRFSEPRAIRSVHKHLRTTLVAQNRPVLVSGIEVAGMQAYAATGPGGKTKPGFLGPTLRANPGDTVEITLDNRLRVPDVATAPNCAETRPHGHPQPGQAGDREFTNLHFHGMHVTPRERSPYGDTVLVHLPNGKSRIRFKIPRNHDKGTFWYHAHLHECTSDQVSRGLAGVLLIGDSRRDLPRRFWRIQTRSLALKDVQVTRGTGGNTWQFDPNYAWFKGPAHRTVNGRVNPKMRIRPGETQLWRLLNVSAGIWYQVVLADESKDGARDQLTVVAQDGNSLLRARRVTSLLIPPGARFDVLVRGPASGSRLLKTVPFNQGGVTFPEDKLATVEVRGSRAPAIAPPGKLVAPTQRFPRKRGPTRQFVFDIDTRNAQSQTDPNEFNPTINNLDFAANSPQATPTLGTTERWIIYNKSPQWHPFHIHQDDFRVVESGPGGQPQLPGDHDMVGLPPGTPVSPSRTVIEMPYTDFPGNFVFHCHILDHEDAGMMALVALKR